MQQTNNIILSLIEKVYANESSKNVSLKKYLKGADILRQGQITQHVLIVKNGLVKCFYSEENCKEFIFDFLGSGEVVGEIEAIRHIKCLCNIQAVTDVEAYSFSTSCFHSLIEQNREFRDAVLGELAERLIKTSQRASFQKAYSAKYGLLKLLDIQKEGNLKLSKSDMASYLGIDIRSLNRLLHAEQDKNVRLISHTI